MPNRSAPKPTSTDSDRSTPIEYDASQTEWVPTQPIVSQRIPRNSSYSSTDEGYSYRRPRRDRIVCRSFMQGHCSFGARCNFSHAAPNAPPPPPYEAAYEGFYSDSCPSTPITQASSSYPTHYRHEPYSLDAFVFFGDDDVTMTAPY